MQTQATILKPGAIVTVYADPITELKQEGEARLIRCLDADYTDQLQSWKVHFLSDDFLAIRFIKGPASSR